MIIAAEYSFNRGKEEIESKYPSYLEEIKWAIQRVNADVCKIKKSKEKTIKNKMLFSPVALNKQFKQYFIPQEWSSYKVICNYTNKHYVGGYKPKSIGRFPLQGYGFYKGGSWCRGSVWKICFYGL